MRKLIITLIICYCAFAANAANVISASSASGHPQDEVTLNISLANTSAVVAFQTEIPLGNNLTYVANSVVLNASRITDHVVSAAVVDGKLRIYAYSLSLTPFVGNSGVLVSFTLKLKNEPGNNAISLASSILSSASGTSLSYSYNNGNVTILSPKIRVNTGTIDYGHVPIRSNYTATASITNVGNEPLTITSISFDDAVFSCPSFTTTTVQAGNNKTFTFKFSPTVKGPVTAKATITSNSISGTATINLVADPYAVNELHINNATGYSGNVVGIPMTVNNMEDIVGFQIDMLLPSELEYVGFELSNRKTDHVAFGAFSNDTLRLIAYSPTSSAFTGTDGVIGTLSLRLNGLYGDYYLDPFRVILADPSGANVLSDTYYGYVTIRSPQIAGNPSLDMGSSSVTQTVTKTYTVYNHGNAPLVIQNVVFDQSDWAVSDNMPMTIQQNGSKILHVSYSREQAGDFAATMKIYSNDPQNGLMNVALSGHRYEPNTLSIIANSYVLDEDDMAVAISMNNYSDIVALQADFAYPNQDYSVDASDFQLTERFANHTLYAIPMSESVYKILVFSMQNSAVEGNEGEIINVTLHPIGNPGNQNYTVSITNVVLSGADGVNAYTGGNINKTFAHITTHSITAAANPAEGGTVSGEGTYNYGTTCNLVATANDTYHFVNWKKNGTVVSTNANYSFIVNGDADFVANFELNSYQINVSANPAAGGTVTGADTYTYGSSATLTATENIGYTFVNWTCNGEEVSTEPTYTFTVTESASYVANFSLNSYQITASANPVEGGTVTGADIYYYGESCTLTVTPNEYYVFLNWTENGEIISETASFSFVVTEDRNIVANLLNTESVNELDDVDFVVYPNPVSDVLYIETDDTASICEIYSTTGRLVYQNSNLTEKTEINVSNFISSTYIIVLKQKEGITARKFIVR